jgi:hypothetical protein
MADDLNYKGLLKNTNDLDRANVQSSFVRSTDEGIVNKFKRVFSGDENDQSDAMKRKLKMLEVNK